MLSLSTRLSTSLTMHSWILCLLKQTSQFSSSWKNTERCVPNHQKSHRDVLIAPPPQITGHSLNEEEKVILQTGLFFPLTALSKLLFLMSFPSSERQPAVPRDGCYCTAPPTLGELEVIESPENPWAWQCRGNLIAASCIQGPYQ